MNRPRDRADNQHPADMNNGREEKSVGPFCSNAPKKVTAAPDSNRNEAVKRWNVLGRNGHGNPRLACQKRQDRDGYSSTDVGMKSKLKSYAFTGIGLVFPVRS